MNFRPCIDLHDGMVKQIVGASLESNSSLQTNFISDKTPAYYAKMYKKDELKGGHIIMLGANNEKAAQSAILAYPKGMQVGGGINDRNALFWLDKGASHIIITSYIFDDENLNFDKLKKIALLVGKDKLVLDLSCRKKGNDYYIVTNRWQTFSYLKLNFDTLTTLSKYCDEFLIHAVDVEGKMSGVEVEVLKIISSYSPIKCVYAGGIRSIEDINLIKEYGKNKIDFTVGSALDIFGGNLLEYKELVKLYSI